MNYDLAFKTVSFIPEDLYEATKIVIYFLLIKTNQINELF